MAKLLDNYLLDAFVLFPLVTVLAALLNMAVAAVFSWSELIFDYLGGVAVGTCFYLGTGAHATGAQHFLLVFSQGLPGVLYLTKVSAFATREALFLDGSLWMIGATFLGAVFDRGAVGIGKEMSISGGFFSILGCAAKLPFSLVTSTIGLLFFVVGIFRSFGDDGRIGFLGGVPYVEWDTTGDDAGTTLGATVQIWSGKFKNIMEHELYHTRQYIYLHDWLVPVWLVGGIWGLISGAIDGDTSFDCFQAARHDRDLGNPLECAAYRISGFSKCP